MNFYVANSKFLQQNFEIQSIRISYKNKIEDTRIFSLKKLGVIITTSIKLLIKLFTFRPKFVYFQISPIGIAFYRDCVFVFLLKVFKKHIVFHLHGKGISTYISNSKLKKLIYQWAFRNNSVICLSKSLIYDIKFIYPFNPYIVNNAIDKVDCNFRKFQNNEKIQILFLSNLIVSKGVFVFLDALKHLNALYSSLSYTAYIVGKEAEINKVQILEEIQNRNLNNNVLYVGPKYNIEKYQMISSMDILIYPTLNDVWGLVILEAMQAGLPVIASREGAIPEIVDDGITGFLVDKNNHEQIVDKLMFLIKNPDIRIKMGFAGQAKFKEKYELKTFELNMQNVFNDVINKN